MTEGQPVGQLQAEFSTEGAVATPWADAEAALAGAEIYWLSTVRPDGRPHVTPLIAVWLEGALFFCTGPGERKAGNLAENPRCVLTTGCNELHRGLDLVVEGKAVRVSDDPKLRRLAAAYESKYGSDWRFEIRDGAFAHEGGQALVFEVRPSKAFGYGRDELYSATRWRF